MNYHSHTFHTLQFFDSYRMILFLFFSIKTFKKVKSHADKALEYHCGLEKANCEIQYYFFAHHYLPFSFFTAIRLKKDHLLLIAANANRLHLKASKTRKVICLNADVSRQISTLRNFRSLLFPFNSNIRFLEFLFFMKVHLESEKCVGIFIYFPHL